MIKIAIIGTQGMLGSAVCRYLSGKDYQILEINSSGKTRCSNPVTQFDILNNDINELKKNLKNIDFVINCAGLIKHKINQNNLLSFNNLIRINSLFPIQLTDLSNELNFKVIQIATDCVYSGNKGGYIETDLHDPTDVYGKTKSLGEFTSTWMSLIRCSIIGREIDNKYSLVEWVNSQLTDASINGFTNHNWNGITTKVFGKLSAGIIKNELAPVGGVHLIPKDRVSKFELVNLIKNELRRNYITVKEFEASVIIDRTLSTNQKALNSLLWQCAGFENPPTISEMINLGL
jgi:dTDP-4-dehydrorhamnose reductase